MEEIDAYNDYDEEDEGQEIIIENVPHRGHGKSLSGKFNAITNLNKLRADNVGQSHDYGSPEVDDVLNEQEYMRRSHNQQMYPSQQHAQEMDDDEDNYLGSEADIEQVVEVIWAQMQVQYNLGD